MGVAGAVHTRRSEEPLLLHGIADAKVAQTIGPGGGIFAGVGVRPITQGRLAALVSWEPRGFQWPSWMRRKTNGPALPVCSALSSMLSFLPVEPGTSFVDVAELERMLTAREPELADLVTQHADYLECEVTAFFDGEAAELDIAASGTLAALRAESEAEQALVRRTLAQSVGGRRAGFFARLRRRLAEDSIDVLNGSAQDAPSTVRRRVLIERSRRGEFRDGLLRVAAESGPGTHLVVGPFLPPISFRKLEIKSADCERIDAARAALGIEETTSRSSIRIAYHRALERFYPQLRAQERKARLAQLQAQFGLLDLVAEGQIRAARSSREMAIRFDADALGDTWLMRFHAHSPADRAA